MALSKAAELQAIKDAEETGNLTTLIAYTSTASCSEVSDTALEAVQRVLEIRYPE